MYVIKEIFATLQGEGHNAGTPAVFVRFAGCNLWSGREGTRGADAKENAAECALWCDTDFVNGERVTLEDIAERVISAAGEAGMISGVPLVVFTGGEPLLQLDRDLLGHVMSKMTGRSRRRPIFAIETNGRTALREEVRELLDWVCVSPKGNPADLKVRKGDEFKVIYPAYDPAIFEGESDSLDFKYWYLQASASINAADGSQLPVGDTRLDNGVMREVALYCIKNPRWRMSIQIHKLLNLP